MNEQVPKMTREEYIKATGVSGNKLVDDSDKAHVMAMAGDESRTAAANAKRAGKIIIEHALGRDGDGRGPLRAALDDIARRSPKDPSQSEKVVIRMGKDLEDDDIVRNSNMHSWNLAAFTPKSRIRHDLSTMLGKSVSNKSYDFPDERNVETHVDLLAKRRMKHDADADRSEDWAGEEYELKKPGSKKADERADELMRKLE